MSIALLNRLVLLRRQMLLKNLQVEGGLTNGTRGVVVGWSDHPHPLPRVRFTAGASVGDGAGAEKTVERVVGPEQWTIDEGGKRLVRRATIFLVHLGCILLRVPQ